MTPDVPRLRALQEHLYRGDQLRPLTVAEAGGLLEALLSDAPPDGAAEREEDDRECGRCDGDGFEPSTHSRNACSLCGGSGRLPTPAPTEAPAAGQDEAFLAWWRARPRSDVNFHTVEAAHLAGWNAAPAARPAAVTDEITPEMLSAMVDAYIRSHGPTRERLHKALAAALAARGPA